MAGSASTITYDNGFDHTGVYGGVKKILIDWSNHSNWAVGSD